MHRNIQQASGEWHLCGSDGVFSPHDLAKEIFDARREGEPQDRRADQVLYLFRRFGYPVYGWDGYKSVIDYVLTTPDPDVVLWCKPASAYWISFGYGVSDALRRDADIAEWMWRSGPRDVEWERIEVYQRVYRAVRAAMRELLRPVYIRDVDYNYLGRVRDGSPYGRLAAADCSPQAGYGLGEYDPVAACV